MIHLNSIAAFAATKAGAVAVEFEGDAITWGELFNSVSAKVGALVRQFGDSMPSQACYFSENGPDLVAWCAAFATLGITATGLDHSARPDVLFKLVDLLNPGFVLCSSHLEGTAAVRYLSEKHALHKFDPFVLSGRQTAETVDFGTPAARPFRAVSVTSGTTGVPKLAIRTESFDKRRFEFFSRKFRLDGGDRFLACVPIHHAAGNGWIRFFMGLGATVVLTDRSDGKSLASLVRERRITTTVLTPVLLDRIVDNAYAGGKRGRPPELRWVLVGGKNFTPYQKRRSIEALGPVHEYFGTTETGVNTLADPIDLLLHPRSVGRAFEGNEIVILGTDGSVLGPDEIGSVAVSSYMNMSHYEGVPANESVINGKRFLVTPDQGCLDAEGRLYLRNRLSSPGATVDLYGIENDIRGIGSIRDVILHQRRGENGKWVSCALVSDEPAHSAENKVRLIVEERGLHLSRFVAVDEIPYSPTGKVRVEFIESLGN